MTALTHKENELHNRLIVAEFNLKQVEEELRRLHEVNAELVEALERIAGFTYSQFADSKDMAIECVMVACKALAKAQGGNND